jgi:hypothetical protein
MPCRTRSDEAVDAESLRLLGEQSEIYAARPPMAGAGIGGKWSGDRPQTGGAWPALEKGLPAAPCETANGALQGRGELRADPVAGFFRANPAQHFYALQHALAERRRRQWREACDREPDAFELAA